MILIDMHPAQVEWPDGTRQDRVRVVLTHRRLRVWAEESRQPQLLVDDAHDGVQLESRFPEIGKALSVPTTSGAVLVTRMRGCGCGSVLKGLRPPTDDEVQA